MLVAKLILVSIKRALEDCCRYKLASLLAGQIPVRNGVIGGVSETPAPIVEKTSTKPLVTTPGALRVVENSGVCETTPGVFQASGYGDLTSTESIFFWYFNARNDPDTAPLSLWFNGGPGSSSMLGLFQELGPCRINNQSTAVTLNPFSWNTNSNMLFIDQPVGVGFSHGTMNVGTSLEAAADVWSFLQIFFNDSRFADLATRKLAIWTESYGGHYGPTFAAYFLSQNAAIAAGTITGIPLNLQVLGVGDGLTDPISQYPGYITYAGSNPYHTLVSASEISSANKSFNTASTGCKARIVACNAGGSNTVCSNAQSTCNNNILSPLAGNWDVYYVLTENPDPYPPDLTSYLKTIETTVGAEVTWEETNDNVYDNFAATGDWMRSSLPDLELVINSGVRVLIYDGDADYILNFDGVEAMIASLNTSFSAQLNKQTFTPFRVNGLLAGQYKNAGTFSYVRIYGAGHEVPAYKNGSLATGQAALQFFSQIMANERLIGRRHPHSLLSSLMSTLAAARFPTELEQEIFETAAELHGSRIPTFLLVARRVYEWLEPMLYRNIRVGMPWADAAADLEQAEAFFAAVRRGKPKAAALARGVHLVTIDQAGEETLARLCAVLPLCRNVSRLAILDTEHMPPGISAVFPHLSEMRLRRLSCTIVPDVVVQVEPGMDSRPAFAHLTHFDLCDDELAPMTVAFIVGLPSLTHLAICVKELDVATLRLLLDRCQTLLFLVFLFPAGQNPQPAELHARTTALELDDARVVVTSYRIWNDCMLDDGYWATVEEFARLKKLGNIPGAAQACVPPWGVC
uniref:Carboxypeptidase n=1 Tax=Mycena chlorophos TaxID=658473 RepID=A0ABQ0L944_MYCCL|nr:carboxypeptidase s1 [Mycena chlorophos]